MADILLDSDVIIAWLRGSESVAGAIMDLLESGHNLLWTPISVAEIFAGARKTESARIETMVFVSHTRDSDTKISGDSSSAHLIHTEVNVALTIHELQINR